ncbi:MAG: DUF6470 family protein [Bacillota bacterium]|nr:DUF6470 family protein [Bacillota bacterium]
MISNIRLDWHKTDAVLEHRGNGKAVLDIRTVAPRLEMERTAPQIRIDQSETFASAGLKSPSRLLADHVAYARQMAMQGMARIASDGNQMIDIHTGTDAIAAQADYNAFGMFENEFGYGVIPSVPPRIEVVPGSITYRFIPGHVENHTIPGTLELTYRPYQMQFFTK